MSMTNFIKIGHLGFVWGIFGPLTLTLQNLVMIDAVVLIFGTFGWKMPIHAPKIVFLGNLVP